MAKKIAFGILGWAIIAVGIVLLPLPGPGLLIIAGGLAVLGRHFHWAKRLERRCRDCIMRRKSPAPADVPAAPPVACEPAKPADH